MIISKRLFKQKKIVHGFFNRIGGKSKGIYKSLNCGLGSNDTKKNVKKNLEIVKNRVCRNSENIFLLNQIHSNRFIFLKKKSKFKKKNKC